MLYSCTHMATVGVIVLKSTVAGDITFHDAPSPQTFQANTDALIRCVVSGEPMPKVVWRYGGRRIGFTREYISLDDL